jgi:hypothetical protein
LELVMAQQPQQQRHLVVSPATLEDADGELGDELAELRHRLATAEE